MQTYWMTGGWYWYVRLLVAVALLVGGLSFGVQAQAATLFQITLRLHAIDPSQERTPIDGATFVLQDAATGAPIATLMSDATGTAQATIPPPTAVDILVFVTGARPDGTPLWQDGADINGYRLPLIDPAVPILVAFIAIPSGQVLPDPELWQGDSAPPPAAAGTAEPIRVTPPPAPYLGDLWPSPEAELDPLVATSPPPTSSEQVAPPVTDPTTADLIVQLQNTSAQPLVTATVTLRSDRGEQHVPLTSQGVAAFRLPPDLTTVAAPPVLVVRVTGSLADGTPLRMTGLDADGIRVLPTPYGADGPLRLDLHITTAGHIVPAPTMFARESAALLHVPGPADALARHTAPPSAIAAAPRPPNTMGAASAPPVLEQPTTTAAATSGLPLWVWLCIAGSLGLVGLALLVAWRRQQDA